MWIVILEFAVSDDESRDEEDDESWRLLLCVMPVGGRGIDTVVPVIAEVYMSLYVCTGIL
jgi:hypothetical protein